MPNCRIEHAFSKRFTASLNPFNQSPYFLGTASSPILSSALVLTLSALIVDPMEVLGEQISLVILSHLDHFSLLRAGAVCRSWRSRSLTEALWARGYWYILIYLQVKQT